MKTSVSFILVILISLNLIAAQNNEKDIAAIKAVIESETESFRIGDFDGWANSWVHEPYAYWLNSGPNYFSELEGWKALNKQFKGIVKGRKEPLDRDYTNNEYNISIFGNVAFAIYDQHLKFTRNNSEEFFVDRGLRLLEKVDDEWKIVFMGSVNKSAYADTSFWKIESYINTLGYMLLNMKRTEEAIKMLSLNTDYFPESWNTWDSLAEAYMNNGDKSNAIINYEKSLKLNPDNENAKKALKKLK